MTVDSKRNTVASLRKQTEFIEFMNKMMTGESVSMDDKNSPPWFQEGVICEVSETLYDYHLEVLPPRWIDGLKFAFGEGSGPFQLFWKRGDDYFGRQLSAEETFHFCRLSGTKLFE